MKMRIWKFEQMLGLVGLLYGVAFSQDTSTITMPHPRAGMCSARIGDKLYLIGGGAPEMQTMRGDDQLESLVGSSIVDVFNFSTQKWDTTAGNLNTPRVHATAVALGDSIYVMGGVDDHGNVLRSVEVYDTTTKTWRYASSMSYSREGAASVVYGDSIFVFGGVGRANVFNRTVEFYSPETGSWSLADTLIWGRAFHHAVRFGKYIYIFGGIAPIFGPIRSIERYDPLSGSTQIALAMSTPRAFFAAVKRDNLTFAISGYGSTNSNGFYSDVDLLDFHAFGRESEAESKTFLHFARAGFVADTDDSGEIYIFGGYSPDYKGSQVPVPYVEVVPSFTAAVNVVSSRSASPSAFTLFQNYPNPFNPTTSISYQVSTSGRVTLKVYDILGRETGILVDRVQAPGKYVVRFDAENLPSGSYIYRLQTDNGIIYRKMVLIK